MKYPYDDLDLERSATANQIKQRYRELVKELHPDVNGPDPIAQKRLQKVNEAYELLSDRDWREMYNYFYNRLTEHPEEVWKIPQMELAGKTEHYLLIFEEMRQLFRPYLAVKLVTPKRSRWRRIWRRQA